MSAIFTAALDRGLTSGMALLSADIRAMLVLSTYTFDAADEFVADVVAFDNGRTVGLVSKTVTDGVFDAANPLMLATAAEACDKVVIFQHTGSDATAQLIACLDITEFTPTVAQQIQLIWDSGASRIFRLLGSA